MTLLEFATLLSSFVNLGNSWGWLLAWKWLGVVRQVDHRLWLQPRTESIHHTNLRGKRVHQ